VEYLFRDEIEEEEILEEGFTLQDDWQWKGQVDAVWWPAINELVQQELSLHEQGGAAPALPAADLPDDAALELQLGAFTLENQAIQLKEAWSFLLQELTQAIFETAQKEAPLEVVYRVVAGQDYTDYVLNGFFSTRKAVLSVRQKKEQQETVLEWQAFKDLMALVFEPDYDPDLILEAPPKKAGQYISTAPGMWHAFGQGVRNPSTRRNVLKMLADAIEGAAGPIETSAGTSANKTGTGRASGKGRKGGGGQGRNGHSNSRRYRG